MKHHCAKLPFPIDLADDPAAECDFCGKTVAEIQTAAPSPADPVESEIERLLSEPNRESGEPRRKA